MEEESWTEEVRKNKCEHHRIHTFPKKVSHEARESLFQIELHKFDSLQRVRLLFLRRAAATALKQRQLLTILHSSKQLLERKRLKTNVYL